jgi:peptide deformylase
VSLRVFTYHCDGFAGHLINPTWTAVGDDGQLGPEGCLSIPGMSWDCLRSQHVVARGWNAHGEPIEVEGTDLLARCIQHETDHLDGVLFLDRLDEETRKAAMREIRQASWFDGDVPVLKQNPHPLFGGR